MVTTEVTIDDLSRELKEHVPELAGVRQRRAGLAKEPEGLVEGFGRKRVGVVGRNPAV